MQSMTSYRRRRYIVEKHKIPTRRHKRTSNVKKFPFPVSTDVQSHCTSVPKWVVRFGNVLPQKNAPRKTKRVFSVCAKAASFRPAAQTLSSAGGDAGVNRPCLPAKKSSSAACLRTFPYYTGFLPACGPLQQQRSTDSVTDALLLAAFGSGVLLVTDAVFWNGAFAQALSIPASCSETASPGAKSPTLTLPVHGARCGCARHNSGDRTARRAFGRKGPRRRPWTARGCAP